MNDVDNDSVYNKTLEYVKTFAKFNTTDSASAVRECVDYSHFTSFHGSHSLPFFDSVQNPSSRAEFDAV
jgi:hypothetical protein